MSAIFNAVRAACEPRTWSRGVELSRGGVSEVGRDEDEISLRVTVAGQIVSPTVTLYPDDADWECTCPSGDDACEHVAAAIIALQLAASEGRSLESQGGPARVGYRLTREGGALALERVIVHEGREMPLEASAIAISQGRAEGPPLELSNDDIAVERAVGTRLRGPIQREAMPRILAALAGVVDRSFEGEAVEANGEAVGPLAVVTDRDDAEGGVSLRLIPDPSITEVFSNHAARCGQVLRPVAPNRLSERELDELRKGRNFAPGEIGELVTRILPGLRERVRVDVRSKRLPSAVSDPPRIALDVSREGEELVVLPTLVYGDPPVARVDGERMVLLRDDRVPLRDESAERRELGRLRRTLGIDPGRRARFSGRDALQVAARIDDWDGDVSGSGHNEFWEAPPLTAQVSVGAEGELELWFDSTDEESGGEAQRVKGDAVLRAWREGTSHVSLTSGGFAPIPDQWLASHGDLLADLLAARERDGSVPTAMAPELARLCDALDTELPPKFERLRTLVDEFRKIPAAELPSDLRAELRPYQREGVDWLSFLRDAGLSALLADDMGLGKTLQALAAAKGRTLVVAPTSVLDNWFAEIAKFRPGLRAARYHGPDRALDPEADVTITTYALLRNDADALAAVEWDTIVLDEAQNVKNPDSQVARAAYGLRGGFRIALTGTPVENRLDELWSQLNFLQSGLFGTRSDFVDRYAKPIADGDEAAALRLRERLRPFVLRRMKSEVARDLPPRTDVVLHCDLDESERAVYDAVRAASQAEIVKRLEGGGNVMEALEALLRLRQAACHSGLVPGGEKDLRKDSSKLRLLAGELETIVAEGHKALVFSQWTSLLDRVEPTLESAGHAYLRLDGSTQNRGEIVEGFQADDGPPILLISLRAGGTGLNLTAADHVFLLDPWWNPAVEDQAADRAHRIGQERPVLVSRLVARDTVEERILKLQERKRALAEAAVGQGGAGPELTRQDLLELLTT